VRDAASISLPASSTDATSRRLTGPTLAEVGATVELAGPVGAKFVAGDEWLREDTIDRSRLVLVNPLQ
jgi:hypothetical protein